MNEANIYFWKDAPSRDDVLEIIYRFLRALSNKNIPAAENTLMVKDMNLFIRKLHDSMLQYLEMVIEDDE